MGKDFACGHLKSDPELALGALTIAPASSRQVYKICVGFSPQNGDEARQALSGLMSALVEHADTAKVLHHCTPTDCGDDPLSTGADIFMVRFASREAYENFVDSLRQRLPA